jgi:indole-3-glycerol phosphate synthase
MSDILNKILATKKLEIATNKAKVSLSQLQEQAEAQGQSNAQAPTSFC